jgi:hypothetical protein
MIRRFRSKIMTLVEDSGASQRVEAADVNSNAGENQLGGDEMESLAS